MAHYLRLFLSLLLIIGILYWSLHFTTQDQPIIYTGYDVLAEVVECDTDIDCMTKFPEKGDF